MWIQVNPAPRAKARGFGESPFGDAPSSPHSSAGLPWGGVKRTTHDSEAQRRRPKGKGYFSDQERIRPYRCTTAESRRTGELSVSCASTGIRKASECATVPGQAPGGRTGGWASARCCTSASPAHPSAFSTVEEAVLILTAP